jgi:hypothetical protein
MVLISNVTPVLGQCAPELAPTNMAVMHRAVLLICHATQDVKHLVDNLTQLVAPHCLHVHVLCNISIKTAHPFAEIPPQGSPVTPTHNAGSMLLQPPLRLAPCSLQPNKMTDTLYKSHSASYWATAAAAAVVAAAAAASIPGMDSTLATCGHGRVANALDGPRALHWMVPGHCCDHNLCYCLLRTC